MNQMDDCFAGALQEFLICITVHKAANTDIPRGELYVKVSLDKQVKNTKTQANSENPFFNEYFVFEFHCRLIELLRLTVLFQLKKYLLYKKNVIVGELLIDLHSVWSQPGHNYFKKWGQLEAPLSEHTGNEEATHSLGFLQIDLAIVSQHSSLRTGIHQEANNLINNHDYDDIKSNMLQSIDPFAQNNIRYYVSFYKGIFIKKSNYMLQVSFAGFKGKTQVIKNTMTPIWNKQISFAWVYPSLAQRFLILIFHHEHLQWKCVSEYELNLEEISFKQTPSLGPTYLHLYDAMNPLIYVGRILIELTSEKLLEDQPSHVVSMKNVSTPIETINWSDETFMVEFLPLMGDHIDTNASSFTLMAKMAEFKSNVIEGQLKAATNKLRSVNHAKWFRQDAPYKSCLFRVNLPDNRKKFGCNFFMADLISNMRAELNIFKIYQLKFPNQPHNHAKCLKFIIARITRQIKVGVEVHRLNYELGADDTTWDKNRQGYLLDYFKKLPDSLRTLRDKLRHIYQEHLDTTVVEIVNEIHRLIGDISSIGNMMRVQDDWPELVITLSTGSKILGVCQLNAKHFMSTPKCKENATTNHCWKVKSFVFKSLSCGHSCANCGCQKAIIIGCVSITLERTRQEYLSCISNEWAYPDMTGWVTNVVQTHFCCHVYVHQAKVRPDLNKKAVLDGHVRIFIAGQAGETYPAHATVSPVWDTVITVKVFALPGSFHWYQQNPPIISVEFFSADNDLLAFGQTTVSVISSDNEANNLVDGRCWNRSITQKLNKLKNLSPPPLKWVPVAKDGVVQAEVLMSAEFIELTGVPEAYIEGNMVTVTSGIPQSIRPNMLNYVLEIIFVGLRNYTKSSVNLAGKRRVKVTIGDLVLSSGLSTKRVRHSINFLVAYAVGVVSLPDQQEYWPAMIATDVVNNSFTNETVLGAALVPNSTCFLQKTTKCVLQPGETSVACSTASTDFIDELPVDYTEDDVDEVPSKVDNWWKRIMIVLGLRTIAYANKGAIRNDDYADVSDLREDLRFNWWTKFYNALHVVENVDLSQACKHSVVIYTDELEKQPQFSFLQDWAMPVPLVHGVKFKKQGPPKEDVYATLKLHIKLTPCQCDAPKDLGGGGDMLRPITATMNPRQQSMIKTLTERVAITVRVYVVRGLQLRPRDWSSDSDCYVRAVLGGKIVSDQAHYIPNQSNPIFGRFFELETTLPDDPILEVAIYDHNKWKDRGIGLTRIDLEDRWHSKHRAHVGLPQEYSQVGYNKWHDTMLPSQLLVRMCQHRGIQPPYFYGNVIEVDGMLFGDETVIAKTEDLRERLSLTVLKNFDKLPSFGYKLVPEHVETRSLYDDEYPTVEQGKLQMWIELFENNNLVPEPIDITPIPPIGYEIRVVVQNLAGIQLQDKNIFGKLMSDIYVVGWCHDVNKSQHTDVHFRSFAGKAAFNWRMVFPMKYSPNEDMMVIRTRGGLWEEIELKRPPMIHLQVWDKDTMSFDDYLGYIELNLSNLPAPYTTERKCQPFPSTRMRLNLFTRKSIKGWFPLHGPPNRQTGKDTSTGGKIELCLDVCTETEASNSPAGLGHDPPMALEKPYRPETSFNPLTNPWKSFHLILWPAIRKYVFLCLLVIFLVFGFILFFVNLPNKILSIPLE